jgi:hypothetical protein
VLHHAPWWLRGVFIARVHPVLEALEGPAGSWVDGWHSGSHGNWFGLTNAIRLTTCRLMESTARVKEHLGGAVGSWHEREDFGPINGRSDNAFDGMQSCSLDWRRWWWLLLSEEASLSLD